MKSIAICLSGLWLLAGCSGIQGSGVVRSETRDVSGFDGIALVGSGQATIRVADEESVIVEAEDNLLPHLRTRVEGTRLVLDADRNISPTRPIVYRITMKRLDHLSISGSGDIEATGIRGDELVVSISGSGDMKVEGEVRDARFRISGSGLIDAERLSSERATATISGSGDMTIGPARAINAHVSGAGSVRYKGSPSVTSQISGAGSISPM